MTTLLRLSACLLVAASLVACDRSEPEPADESAAVETAATEQVEESAPPAATDDPTVPLTMDNARAYVQALKNLRDMGVDSVAVEPGETTAQFEARLASVPQVSAAIENAGMSVGEFARFGDLFIGAVMAQSAIEAGQMQAPPEGMEAAVAFVEQNKTEIHALLNSMEETGG